MRQYDKCHKRFCLKESRNITQQNTQQKRNYSHFFQSDIKPNLFDSIIIVGGKSPMDIMELILL